ncbi:MAG: ROK family transcriptional regulator [Spirochaetia bacterium]|nr:ROK family transcriptional regulator [Spirochaetia bacterium]
MAENKSPLRGDDIRKRNEKLILGLIHKHQNLSQSEAANITGLKPPTVLRIFGNLENEKLIKVNKKSSITNEKKGRKPVYYKINSKAAYAIGVDFCSTSASVVIVDFNRQPVFSDFIVINENHTGESIFMLLCTLIDNAIVKSEINRMKILGIGIGAPGKVDISTGTVLFYDRIEGLSHFSLKDRFHVYFQIPIFINNNCSVIAMNEYLYGIVSDSNSLITLLIRSGVGGAFVNEGKVLTTNNITTMEVGHISIDYNGRQCECGENGCLQAYLSEEAVLKDISTIKKLSSFMDIEELIQTGGGEIELFLKEKAELLCKGLKILRRSLSPDTFLIISRSPLYAEKLCTYAQEIMSNDPCKYDNVDELIIKHSQYNPINAGQGAADMVFNHYFTN